jgi:thioredoxin 1
MKTLEISSATEFEKVTAQDKPVLIDFWAAWCGPCKMVAPEVEALVEIYEGKAVVCKIDVDKQAEIATRFQVMSIPTLVFLKDGKEVNRIVGYQPRQEIAKALDKVF